MDRRAALLLFTALGCAPGPATSTQPPPEPSAAATVSAARRSPPRRPAPEVMQALAELERNPDLHVVVVGSRAEPVRKAMLRAAHGRVDGDRIQVSEPDPDAPPSRPVEFRFFVPPPEAPAIRALHSYVAQ